MKDLNLRKAFPIVAAALGNKLGINVMVTGTQACTNGSNIRVFRVFRGSNCGF